MHSLLKTFWSKNREDTGTKYLLLASTVTPSPDYSSEDQLLFTSPWFPVLHITKSIFVVFVVRYNASKYKKNYKCRYKCKRNERLIMALTNAKNTKNIAV